MKDIEKRIENLEKHSLNLKEMGPLIMQYIGNTLGECTIEI